MHQMSSWIFFSSVVLWGVNKKKRIYYCFSFSDPKWQSWLESTYDTQNDSNTSYLLIPQILSRDEINAIAELSTSRDLLSSACSSRAWSQDKKTVSKVKDVVDNHVVRCCRPCSVRGWEGRGLSRNIVQWQPAVVVPLQKPPGSRGPVVGFRSGAPGESTQHITTAKSTANTLKYFLLGRKWEGGQTTHVVLRFNFNFNFSHVVRWVGVSLLEKRGVSARRRCQCSFIGYKKTLDLHSQICSSLIRQDYVEWHVYWNWGCASWFSAMQCYACWHATWQTCVWCVRVSFRHSDSDSLRERRAPRFQLLKMFQLKTTRTQSSTVLQKWIRNSEIYRWVSIRARIIVEWRHWEVASAYESARLCSPQGSRRGRARDAEDPENTEDVGEGTM